MKVEDWLKGSTWEWLDDDEGIIPMTGLFVEYGFIFIIDFDDICPVGGAVHEMMLSNEKWKSKDRCFIEHSIIALIILSIDIWLAGGLEYLFT